MKSYQNCLVQVCSWLCLIALFFSQLACEPEKNKQEKPIPPAGDKNSVTRTLYVLCEGLYSTNGTTLYVRNEKTGEFVQDMFRKTNQRWMGDTGNDLEIYGSKMYATLNGSNVLEVMDVDSARSLKQIPMVNEDGVGRQPRFICAYEGKIYVSSFDNTVCRIDTASLQIEAVCQVGRNPDGLCVANGKLYVANSGGLDNPNYDNTVSVVDLATFSEIKKITVGLNPYRVEADSKGNIYVCTRGNYDGYGNRMGAVAGSSPKKVSSEDPEPYNFYRIDSRTDEVSRCFDIPVLNFCIDNDTAYMYHYDYKSQTCWIKVYDLVGEQIVCEDFIADGTKLKVPYAIAVDPNTGLIYVSDAYNFQQLGSVYAFTKDGRLRYALHQVGLNPSSFAFLPD